MFKSIKKFVVFSIGYIIHIIIDNQTKIKLLSLMKLNNEIFFFLKIIRNIYFSFWLKNIYLNIKNPEDRIYYQKICLTGLTANLDWPKSENSPLEDIKSKFIFDKVDEIINNKSIKSEKFLIIQIGSSSGRFIWNIANKYRNINCIGIDYINEYIDYSKLKYSNYKNLNFIHKSAHKINEILDLYQNFNFILFSIGSSAYIQPEHLEDLFSKISKYENVDFLLAESYYEHNFDKNYDLKPINFKDYSAYNGGMHYSHKYSKFSEKSKFKIIHNKIDNLNNSILCWFKT